MKKQILTLALFLSLTSIFAQAPQAFNYQAVVRNNQGEVIFNQIVSLRISILQGSPLGDAVYVETHQIATNQYGIANIQIGEGTALTGNFSQIAWASTTHFVKTELDITGNEQYEFIGTSQLLSVPYALYAAEAGNAGNNNDTSSTNELQVLNLSNDTLYLSNGNQVYLGNYLDNTDNQTLDLTGTDLTISNGNTISLAGEVDLDSDPTNEIQTLHYTNDTISLSQANQIIFPHDADRDSINELQVLALIEDTLFLSSGNYVVFPHDADRDSTNELQSLSFSNDTIFLSNGNFIHIPQISSALVPEGSCIQSLNPIPPAGYEYSGDYITASDFEIKEWTMPGPGAKRYDETNMYLIWDYEIYKIDHITDESIFLTNYHVYRKRDNSLVYKNTVYMFRTSDNANSQYNSYDKYNVETNTWEYNLPIPLLFSNYDLESTTVAILSNDKIYFMGGRVNGDSSDVVIEFNPENNTWLNKAPLPFYSVSYKKQVEHNGIIYFVGSGDQDEESSDLISYNTNTDTWQTLADMNNPRTEFLSVICIDNFIYVYGGNQNKSFERYNINTNTWETLASLPYDADGYVGLYNDGPIILAFGGCNSQNSEYYDEIAQYSPVFDEWGILPITLPYPSYINSDTKIPFYFGIDYSNDKAMKFIKGKYYYIHCR